MGDTIPNDIDIDSFDFSHNIYSFEFSNTSMYHDFNEFPWPIDNPTTEPVMVSSNTQIEDNFNMFQSQREEDDIFNQIAFPVANTNTENEPVTETKPAKPSHTKSTELENTITFNGTGTMCYMGHHFELTAPPALYQRARYETELNKALRYIFIPNNDSLTLELSDHPQRFARNMLCFLQIIRTTVPFGPNRLTLLHPYPLWINDRNASIFNNTILIPIKTQTIKIDRLTMVRSKQGSLKSLRNLPIYQSEYMDFVGSHSINLKKKEKIVDIYQLRKSLIHFRICVVTQDNYILPTDLSCVTQEIVEFEGPEVKELPEDIRLIYKQSSKRKRVGELNKSSTSQGTTNEFLKQHDVEDSLSLDSLLGVF